MTVSLRYVLDNLSKAIQRLREAVELPMRHPIVLEGTIHRFEFAYETVWTLLKIYFEHKSGVQDEQSARSLFKEAVTAGLFQKSEDWLVMIADRNAASHAYDQETTRAICERIQIQHIQTFEALLLRLQNEIEKQP